MSSDSDRSREVSPFTHYCLNALSPITVLPPSLSRYQQEQDKPSPLIQTAPLPPIYCCNCRKSRCLKLYCPCFAQKQFCSGCSCLNCKNKQSRARLREKAINKALERNPEAFIREVTMKGCNCKKTRCNKKYCECFQKCVVCTEKCRCNGCNNINI